MDQESQGYSFKQGGQSRLCWEVFNFLSKKAEESDGVSRVDIQGKAFQAKGPASRKGLEAREHLTCLGPELWDPGGEREAGDLKDRGRPHGIRPWRSWEDSDLDSRWKSDISHASEQSCGITSRRCPGQA